MLNPQMLAQMFKMNQQDSGKLMTAWQQAQAIAGNITNQSQALEVLKQQGIGSDFIGKVQGYLNNPIAGMIAKAAGINIDEIRNALNVMQGNINQPSGNNYQVSNNQIMGSNPVSGCGSKMDMLRAGLQQLKK